VIVSPIARRASADSPDGCGGSDVCRAGVSIVQLTLAETSAARTSDECRVRRDARIAVASVMEQWNEEHPSAAKPSREP
jgi:hypothetical protein